MAYGYFIVGGSAPVETGIYNIFLQDTATQARYALVMENGLLCGLPVEINAVPTEMTFIDTVTGAGFTLGMENKLFYIEEV